MNIVMISPGYPAEMALFARGLAAGATVIGVGDQPVHAVPQPAREALAHYVRVGSLANGDAVSAAIQDLARHVHIDLVECLWEPYMLLAARLREELGLPGLTMRQTMPFRDKELMKAVLDEAGLRTPGHHSTDTVAGVWAAAERLGYPLIVKPIAGAGSADTYRADSPADLDAILPMVRHVPQVIVEEFVDGEEFTYDTICAGGQVLFENICWYRPAPTAHQAARMDEPGHHLAARPGRAGPAGRPGARRRHREGAGLPRRVHPHGVVPQGRRRGGVR